MIFVALNVHLIHHREGSCNDVVEIELKEEGPPVKLQRGPKSYTYGQFIKALELFHDAGSDGRRDLQDDSLRDGGRDGDDGGLEAFLDDCDDEEDYEDDEDEGGVELDGMMYNSTTFGDSDLLDGSFRSSSSTKAEGMTKELRALEALHSSLKQAVERCESNSLIRRSVGERVCPTAEDEYCVMLIKSEMQTISFYTKATEMIHSKLSKSLSQVNSLVDSKFEIIGMDREHINDLVEAFMTIRYPEVSI
eukprot:scaffold16098_cov80-Skeletonema_menzelii.AAC.2